MTKFYYNEGTYDKCIREYSRCGEEDGIGSGYSDSYGYGYSDGYCEGKEYGFGFGYSYGHGSLNGRCKGDHDFLLGTTLQPHEEIGSGYGGGCGDGAGTEKGCFPGEEIEDIIEFYS